MASTGKERALGRLPERGCSFEPVGGLLPWSAWLACSGVPLALLSLCPCPTHCRSVGTLWPQASDLAVPYLKFSTLHQPWLSPHLLQVHWDVTVSVRPSLVSKRLLLLSAQL